MPRLRTVSTASFVCLSLSLVLAPCTPGIGTAAAAAKAYQPPAGVKVASGAKFDIHVVQVESKPFAGTGRALNVFEAVVVVHETRRGGRQRYKRRAESIGTDLVDPAMWRVGDFDGDGFDDYRYVAESSARGCRTWYTWLWVPERERFTLGSKIVYRTDGAGKAVARCT